MPFRLSLCPECLNPLDPARQINICGNCSADNDYPDLAEAPMMVIGPDNGRQHDILRHLADLTKGGPKPASYKAISRAPAPGSLLLLRVSDRPGEGTVLLRSISLASATPAVARAIIASRLIFFVLSAHRAQAEQHRLTANRLLAQYQTAIEPYTSRMSRSAVIVFTDCEITIPYASNDIDSSVTQAKLRTVADQLCGSRFRNFLVQAEQDIRYIKLLLLFQTSSSAQVNGTGLSGTEQLGNLLRKRAEYGRFPAQARMSNLRSEYLALFNSPLKK